MKKIYVICALSFLFFNCSKKDSENTSAVVQSISSTQTFIGDTLVLKGQNLSDLTRIVMRYRDIEGSKSINNFLYQSDNEIKFIVPEVNHESVSVFTTDDNPQIDVEIYGFIPYSFANNGTFYRRPEVIQLLSDDILYLESPIYNIGRFKLTNNLTDYYPLQSRNEGDLNYYYASENAGWILATGTAYNAYDVYSFTDDINNRSLEYNISAEDINYENIKQMKFISNNLAYILTSSGNMYKFLNGQIISFYDLYPNLNNPYNPNDASFQLLEDNSIIISTGEKQILRFSDTSFKFINFDSKILNFYENNISKPVFYGNVGAFYSNQKIFKSNDYGLTWTENNIDITLGNRDGIQFLGGSQFLLHVGSSPNNPFKRFKYISTDNGVSWKLIYRTSDVISDLRISDQYGISTSGPTGSYGLIKFRKFPIGY